MQLTSQTLAELVSSLRSNQATVLEKRRHPRVGLRARAQIMRSENDSKHSVWVRDVSAGGINVLVNQAFEVGDVFQVVLGTQKSEWVTCIVRHCRKCSGELFSIGAQFSEYKPKRFTRKD